MRKRATLILLILTVCMTSIAVASIDGSENAKIRDPENTSLSYRNITYDVTFYEENLSLIVVASNNGTSPEFTSFDISIGRSVIEDSFPHVSEGETIRREYNVSSHIPMNSRNHTINLGTFDTYKEINFSIGLNESESVGIPLPRIENVEVTSATIDEEHTTALRITVRNEANVQYLTDIRVTTLETHSGPHSGRVPIEENRRTVLVPLNEDPEMIVAGEVRLYTGWVHNESRIADQVEFEGTVDGGTEVWDREFEPIQVDYANRDVDEYQYENATVAAKNEDIWRERLKPVAAVAGVMLVGILLVVALLSRRR